MTTKTGPQVNLWNTMGKGFLFKISFEVGKKKTKNQPSEKLYLLTASGKMT